jgi:predicted peroxiredoxin
MAREGEACGQRVCPIDREAVMSRVLIKSAWGSDDPTKAAFALLHANAFAEAGHEVQIFLLGEAVALMRSSLEAAVVPVGWPPLAEILPRTRELGVPIHI